LAHPSAGSLAKLVNAAFNSYQPYRSSRILNEVNYQPKVQVVGQPRSERGLPRGTDTPF